MIDFPPYYIMFNKIVLGLDGSESSLNALRYAIHLAHQDNAELVLISAAEPNPLIAYTPGGSAYFPKIDEEILEGMISMQKTQLDKVKAANPGLRVSGIVEAGRPAGIIKDLSKDADLIVIGHRGNNGILSLLLGSVARELVDTCTVPVLVVKNKEYC